MSFVVLLLILCIFSVAIAKDLPIGDVDDCTRGLEGFLFAWDKSVLKKSSDRKSEASSASAYPILFEGKDDLWGYKNHKGKVVLSPRYILAEEFSKYGIAAVLEDSGWKYIDEKGKTVIKPFIFDNGPDYFQEGLARFLENGKIGFFDEKGKIVIPAKFDFAFPFSKGIARVCNGCYKVPVGEHSTVEGGTWGLINRQGEVVNSEGDKNAEKLEDESYRKKTMTCNAVDTSRLLPPDFKVYVSESGVVNWPAPGYQEKILPTINRYAGKDGGYVAIYTRNSKGAVYSVGDDIYVIGQIRVKGKYIGRIFYPEGYSEGDNITQDSTILKLCDHFFPEQKGQIWIGGDTGGWYGIQP